MTDRTALITGAGRSAGLGIAVARALAAQGHHVIVTARDGGQAEEQAAVLRSEGLSAEGLRLDLADTDDFARVAAHVRDGHGRLDVLVNNASCMPDFDTPSMLDADIDYVRTALDVNVVGVWALVQALSPLLRAAPAARVVNVSSGAYQQIAAGADYPRQVGAPAYSFSKYALNALTASLAATFRDTDVLVNAVDPGRVDTHPELGVDEEDRPASESAVWVAWAATLPADGPTGGVFFDGERLA
ncbi:SDR family NAD(P)-dependent oxidoreductase [Kitasatospora sp. NPDC058184]|uniref:SDR family NAD(P)-dependent oxidoreductase n=1 Tax=Kitasatospora sp. NPDC058184 TaxID=3346370 RepID=UPI0036DE7758